MPCRRRTPRVCTGDCAHRGGADDGKAHQPQRRHRQRRRWLILAILSLSLIVIGLDVLIIAVALPEVQTSLSATADELLWTVNAYTVAFGGLLLLSGTLADRFGRRRLLLLGLLAFLVFSVGAAYATSAVMLIACRAGMGVGSTLIMPTTLAIIKHVFPAEERSRAIAIWSAAAGIGVPFGPVVGGFLLDHFWWGSVFLVNVPVAGLALIAGAAVVPESRDEQRRSLDVVGATLSVGGLVALVFGLIQGPDYGWADARTLALLAGGLALLAAFAVWEGRTSSPMIDRRLFRDPRFGGPAAAIVCVAFALFGSLFLVTRQLVPGDAVPAVRTRSGPDRRRPADARHHPVPTRCDQKAKVLLLPRELSDVAKNTFRCGYRINPLKAPRPLCRIWRIRGCPGFSPRV